MQTRIKSNIGIRRRGSDYGKTACISFAGHELDLIETWEELADQTFLSKSGVFKKFLRTESRKQKERAALQDSLQGVSLWIASNQQ